MKLHTSDRILHAILLFCCSGVALAHPGPHTSGWLASLLHGFTALDHWPVMLVALVIGVWAAKGLLRNSPWKRY